MLALIERQERVSEKLIEAQARLQQQDARMASRGVATLTTAAPPLSPRAPLLIGGEQPEGYQYVGLNSGVAIWGHSDIVSASVVVEPPPATWLSPSNT